MKNENTFETMETLEFTCCICGKRCKGFGNNPWPVKEEGDCCNDCNATVVIPARMKERR